MLNKPTIALMLWLLLLQPTYAFAQGEYIDIFPKSAEDIEAILSAVEDKLDNPGDESVPPIVMMLHGKEAARFLKRNYAENKDLVDLTAKLAGFGLLNVQICERWLRSNDHPHSELFPFTSTVPFGEDEVERLVEEEGYTEYTVGL